MTHPPSEKPVVGGSLVDRRPLRGFFRHTLIHTVVNPPPLTNHPVECIGNLRYIPCFRGAFPLVPTLVSIIFGTTGFLPSIALRAIAFL